MYNDDEDDDEGSQEGLQKKTFYTMKNYTAKHTAGKTLTFGDNQ